MAINSPFITDAERLRMLNDSHRGELKYTLMNDFLTKYCFQNDLYALKGLLAALLHIEVSEIKSIDILNPIELGDNITDKECLLDIKLSLNNFKVINIEVQSRFQDFWPERSITYLCRNFDHLKPGESYNLVYPCIHIGILSNSLFKKEDPRYTDDFYSEYRLLNTKSHLEYSSKFEIRVLLLNHLDNASDEDKNNPNGLYHWARLFNASTWEELKMIAKENKMIESFVGTVMQLTAEDKVAEACEARRRYSNDIATYEEEIATRNAIISDKESIIANKEATIAEKEATIAEKEATIAEMDATIADKDKTIEDYAAQIKALKEQLADSAKK